MGNNIVRKIGKICGCGPPPRPENRTVYINNHPVPDVEVYIPEHYVNNKIISSKYTLWNFLPKNLFEQFQRIANFYFLCIGIIQLTIDTPVSPATSILPLIFVISVTAIKQGYEDWLRHKADNDVNRRPAYVLRNGKIEQIKSEDIKVGDIVRVQMNQGFPCDMVMLSSHQDDGQCYIQTMNLDGETNLKTHLCVMETRQLQTPEVLENFRAKIECQQPIVDLYRFIGRLTVYKNGDNFVRPLCAENVLLRGARLKNTPFIFGCAIYTGQETKMALNSKFKKTKFSRVEIMMNKFLLVFMTILVTEAALCTGLKYLHIYQPSGQPWYIPPEHTTVHAIVQTLLSFIILFNYIIPISLYVAIELQKFSNSMWFGLDIEMYDPLTNQRAKANTSDLNEELGQIEHLFTDKTGTLTENDMQFRQCSIDGQRFIEQGGLLCVKADIPGCQPTPIYRLEENLENFFTVLALCHTVRLDRHDSQQNGASSSLGNNNLTLDQLEYHASSPDEKAFVEAGARYGVVFRGTCDDLLEVSFHGTTRRFQPLHILEFDSVRKCMSVIVRNEKGEYYLLCKGAETSVLQKCTSGPKPVTLQHVDEYAMIGLRTMVIAEKKLSEDEFARFDAELKQAKMALDDRENKLSQVYDRVEQGLAVLGATAVEDRLQDGVPETIQALRTAGIKVWVLTGDKEETAVNISHSANHFKTSMNELRLTQQKNSAMCQRTIDSLVDRCTDGSCNSQALIVDGVSLAFAITDHRKTFLQLCEMCDAVLCCRMSPIQKAEVVHLIKSSKNAPVTAAIGDGANDCSMIQEAHVGLGIMGKEGRQAVRCSDYAFGRFRFLMRALLMHGNYFYIRLATLVQYYFYKNIVFITAEVFYAFFSAYSAQTIYETIILMFYNQTFTSLPIFIYSLFEQHIEKERLLNHPELYKKNKGNVTMSWWNFFLQIMLGFWHATVSFFGVYLLYGVGTDTHFTPDGKMFGLFSYGLIVIINVTVIVNFKLFMMTNYWTVMTLFGYAMTFVGNVAMMMLYCGLRWPLLQSHQDLFWVFYETLGTPSVWMSMLILTAIGLTPDFLVRVVYDTRHRRDEKHARTRINKWEQQEPHDRSERIPLNSLPWSGKFINYDEMD
ncbi:phospholipid-transporting ATPase IF-like isoform X2 [Tubulanus polymorphus]|uniref:phospholipid-transporting ATPase IF-like isoform X2 n=1 Tax=Tubulanus polymorphus TaxID=672921 RepID=UPI003DA4ACF2